MKSKPISRIHDHTNASILINEYQIDVLIAPVHDNKGTFISKFFDVVIMQCVFLKLCGSVKKKHTIDRKKFGICEEHIKNKKIKHYFYVFPMIFKIAIEISFSCWKKIYIKYMLYFGLALINKICASNMNFSNEDCQ